MVTKKENLLGKQNFMFQMTDYYLQITTVSVDSTLLGSLQ